MIRLIGASAFALACLTAVNVQAQVPNQSQVFQDLDEDVPEAPKVEVVPTGPEADQLTAACPAEKDAMVNYLLKAGMMKAEDSAKVREAINERMLIDVMRATPEDVAYLRTLIETPLDPDAPFTNPLVRCMMTIRISQLDTKR
jgi:hypothetical protein